MPLSQSISISIPYDQIRVSGTLSRPGGPVNGYVVEFIKDGSVVYSLVSRGQDEVFMINVAGSIDGQLTNA